MKKPFVINISKPKEQEKEINMEELMLLIDQQELDPEDVGPVKDIGGVD